MKQLENMSAEERAADLRALRARARYPLYLLAADVRESRLGLMLSGRLELPLAVAQRAYDVLQGKVPAA